MKNIVLRAATGSLYVIAILGCIWGGTVSFLTLCLVLAAVAMLEYGTLSAMPLADDRTKKGATAKSAPWLTRAIDILLTLGLVALPYTIATTSGTWMVFVALWLVLLLARFTAALYIAQGRPLYDTANSLMGLLYIGLPLSLIQVVFAATPHLVLLMFVLIWLNDTGAFLVGSTMGRHRLFPRISPKKSWEGFWGGMLFCIAASVGATLIWPEFFFLPAWQMGIYGVLVCIFSTWGDLFESLIKRTIGVKDSGKLLPGHGGILDRIDSLLFVSIITAAFIFFV